MPTRCLSTTSARARTAAALLLAASLPITAALAEPAAGSGSGSGSGSGTAPAQNPPTATPPAPAPAPATPAPAKPAVIDLQKQAQKPRPGQIAPGQATPAAPGAPATAPAAAPALPPPDAVNATSRPAVVAPTATPSTTTTTAPAAAAAPVLVTPRSPQAPQPTPAPAAAPAAAAAAAAAAAPAAAPAAPPQPAFPVTSAQQGLSVSPQDLAPVPSAMTVSSWDRMPARTAPAFRPAGAFTQPPLPGMGAVNAPAQPQPTPAIVPSTGGAMVDATIRPAPAAPTAPPAARPAQPAGPRVPPPASAGGVGIAASAAQVKGQPQWRLIESPPAAWLTPAQGESLRGSVEVRTGPEDALTVTAGDFATVAVGPFARVEFLAVSADALAGDIITAAGGRLFLRLGRGDITLTPKAQAAPIAVLIGDTLTLVREPMRLTATPAAPAPTATPAAPAQPR